MAAADRRGAPRRRLPLRRGRRRGGAGGCSQHQLLVGRPRAGRRPPVLADGADGRCARESAAAGLLRAGLGRWLTVRHSLIGRIGPSQYVRKPTDQEQSLFGGERSRYLVVYPFTKSTDWYLLSKEARQGVMNEHMRVGHEYPTIRQALAYSFGLDSQEFVVAYETDDLVAFGDLVRALRSTESRRSTVSDTPILLGIHRPIDEILGLLGAAVMADTARGLADGAQLVERAERLFPGGVNSPVRAFRAVGRPPLVLERGEGPYVWDADGGATSTTSAPGGRRSSATPTRRSSRRSPRAARERTGPRRHATRSRSSSARRSGAPCRRWSASGSPRRAPRRS